MVLVLVLVHDKKLRRKMMTIREATQKTTPTNKGKIDAIREATQKTRRRKSPVTRRRRDKTAARQRKKESSSSIKTTAGEALTVL